MLEELRAALSRVEQAGWKVHLEPAPRALPTDVRRRYAWLPADIEGFVSELEFAVNPNETAWLLGWQDFVGTSSSAFKWNEWEILSIDAVRGDRQQQEAVTRLG